MDIPIPNEPTGMWFAAMAVTLLLGLASTIFTLQQRQQMSLQKALVEGLQKQAFEASLSERRCREEIIPLRTELEHQRRLLAKLRAIIKANMPNVNSSLEDTDEINAVEFERTN